VDDRSQRGGDGKAARLDDAVRQVNEFDAEGANLERLPGMHLAQHRGLRQFMFNQLGMRQRQGEGSAVDRHVNLFQQIGQAANVIFVAVRQDNGANTVAIGTHVTEVGNDNVHAEQFGVRKHDAAVNNNDVVVKLKRHHVHAEFAEATKRYCFQLMV